MELAKKDGNCSTESEKWNLFYFWTCLFFYSKISASNGPPGFSQAQVNAFTQMLNNSDSKPKFDYDMPLEALLDDGGDDIDNEAEILMWIKDFLTNELGKLGVNVPMLLMNNIRSLGSDELVLQVR